MICPKCNNLAAVISSKTIVEGDDSPDKETKVFKELRFSCRNEKCVDFGKEIGIKRNPIKIN